MSRLVYIHFLLVGLALVALIFAAFHKKPYLEVPTVIEPQGLDETDEQLERAVRDERNREIALEIPGVTGPTEPANTAIPTPETTFQIRTRNETAFP